MAIDVPLIWPSGKAKYFLFWGLTRFPEIRSDLLASCVCRPISCAGPVADVGAALSRNPRYSRFGLPSDLHHTVQGLNVRQDKIRTRNGSVEHYLTAMKYYQRGGPEKRNPS